MIVSPIDRTKERLCDVCWDTDPLCLRCNGSGTVPLLESELRVFRALNAPRTEAEWQAAQAELA